MSPPLRLSIVIPAYNEERRLPRTLDRILAFLVHHFKEAYEIVIVDDGSSDRTAALAEDYGKRHPQVRLLRQQRNQGRGMAVRVGVEQARGEMVLETDADGSVDDEAIVRFVGFLDRHPNIDVLIGSRNIDKAEIMTPQPLLRVLLGYGFLYMAKAIFGWSIQDYTLGFKLFRREAALDIFAHQFDNGFLAEAEIVLVAQSRGWRVQELPTFWTDFRESRVHPVMDSLRSLKGLGLLLNRQRQGLYAEGLRRLPFRQAARRVKGLYAGLGWPALFNHIRFFTAPYSQLEPYVPRQGLIIDLGCGYGAFTNLLAILAPGRNLLGLELNENKIRHADRGESNARFLRADITKTSTEPADCILLIHVLHHLDSYAQQTVLLKACVDRLKPGGSLLICEVDRLPRLKLILARLADGLLYPGDPIFYRYPDEMLPLLEEAGLSVEPRRMHSGTPFSHITYIAVKPRI